MFRFYKYGLVLIFLTLGCKSTESKTTDTKSAGMTLEARVDFLEKYLRFRRKYEELEFHIVYHDNSAEGFIPGPSDWDIRIVAKVPSSEVDNWLLADAARNMRKANAWVATTAEKLETQGIQEWYKNDFTEVGLDRKNNIVAYRSSSMK